MFVIKPGLGAMERKIWSNESCFTLFPTFASGKSHPKSIIESLLSRVKHGEGSLMLWAAILWFTVGPMITLQGHIAMDYVNILADQAHPMIQTLFSSSDGVFQNDKAPVHTAHIV